MAVQLWNTMVSMTYLNTLSTEKCSDIFVLFDFSNYIPDSLEHYDQCNLLKFFKNQEI